MTKPKSGRFLLIYASQTGQAQSIAEEVAERCGAYGLEADLQCMEDTEKKFWLERETCAVLITSTTGEGDPPDNGRKLWRRLKKRTLESDHFKNLNYSILGLGDTNYNSFCNCAKMFDKRLRELGAKHFYDPAWADDAVGLEVIVEPWLDGLFQALQNHLQLQDDPADACNANTHNHIDETTEKHATHNHSAHNHESMKNGDDATLILSSDSVKENSDQAPNEQTTDLSLPHEISTDIASNRFQESTVSDTRSISINSGQFDENDDVGPKIPLQSFPGDEKLQELNLSILDQSDLNMSMLSVQDETSLGDEDKQIEPVVSCLERPSEELVNCQLSYPVCPAPYLHIAIEDKQMDTTSVLHQGAASLPSADSPVHNVPVVSAKAVTSEGAVKTAIKVTLDLSGCNLDYRAGDSFGIICPNDAVEVDQILNRLGLSTDADHETSLTLLPETKKKNPRVPEFFNNPGTPRHWLAWCCDVRKPPKKAFLRALAEYCTVRNDKRRMLELCSKQGMKDYNTFVMEPHISLLDILLTFPSCKPSLECILEHCPRLLPRPYSAASSGLRNNNTTVDFVFNIVEFPKLDGRKYDRLGVCTGWLKQFVASKQDDENGRNLINGVHQLANIPPKVQVYLRNNQHFRHPDAVAAPIIMVGPGTGVAPFIGFLQERQMMVQEVSGDDSVGASWLFYGCRNERLDFLFREEIDGFVTNGTLTNLKACFSRDSSASNDQNSPRYVQDNILLHGSELTPLILADACVFVCGDAKGMSKDVGKAFVEILATHGGMNELQALGYVAQMRIKRRYFEDVWT